MGNGDMSRNVVGGHTKPMVLAGDFNTVCGEVVNGLVCAAVTFWEFVGGQSTCKC